MRHLPFRQANITMQRIYQSSQLNDKNASRELKNVFFSRFQLYAKAYVHWTLYLWCFWEVFQGNEHKKNSVELHIEIELYLSSNFWRRRVCKLWSVHVVLSFPLKLLANLKVFLFWLCYKTDAKWLQYPLLSYGYTQKDYCLARIAINYHLCALQP